MNLCFLL